MPTKKDNDPPVKAIELVNALDKSMIIPRKIMHELFDISKDSPLQEEPPLDMTFGPAEENDSEKTIDSGCRQIPVENS